MTNNVYLVFSEKPAHIGDDEYGAWYADHARRTSRARGSSAPSGTEHAATTPAANALSST